MRLRHFGSALDAVLLATTAFLLSSSPLVAFLHSSPGGLVSGLGALADGAPYARSFSGSPSGGGGAPSPTKWADYFLGDNLGALASASRDAARFHALDTWLNSIVLPAAAVKALPHVLAIWARNCIAGWLLYLIVGGAWAATIYGSWGRARFFTKGGGPPPWGDMALQVQISLQAMVLYSLMPTLGEWLIERGWTHAYLDWPALQPLALARYVGGIAAYLFLVVRACELCRHEDVSGRPRAVRFPRLALHPPLVSPQEWGIYWVHRYLHDNKFLYKFLHRTHHIYNNNLSPFAGLAFHPIDGMLQVRRRVPLGLVGVGAGLLFRVFKGGTRLFPGSP